MRYWTLLGEAPIPGTSQTLVLYQGKDDFSIKIAGGHELMNTRKHGSEDALGRLPCQRLQRPESARVLIGGLGMGFTLAAVLKVVGPEAVVTVAELIPEVVDWNRGPLGEHSAYPLNDPRTRVHIGDVAKLLRGHRHGFDVIALDVDNGPEGLTKRSNDWLYSAAGIAAAQDAPALGAHELERVVDVLDRALVDERAHERAFVERIADGRCLPHAYELLLELVVHR